MELIDFIALGVLFISLVGIGIIVGRKFPTLASIDVGATKIETAQRKSTLLEQRLRRKMTSLSDRSKTSTQPVINWFKASAGRVQKKLVDLQQEYRIRSLPVLLNRKQHRKLQSEVATLLDQAKVFMKESEFEAAEEKALQAIRLEMRSVPAYELLGELYLESKQYQYAKEVYRYLLKLVGEKDAIYEHLAEAEAGAGELEAAETDLKHAVELNENMFKYQLELADVERQLTNWPEAFKHIQAAARLEPNHPKVLDEMIEISIGYGKKDFAEDAITKIKSTNPENKKIPDWEERLAAIK